MCHDDRDNNELDEGTGPKHTDSRSDHNSRMVFRARSSPKRPSLPPPCPGPPPGRVSTSTPLGCFRAARSHHDATCSSAPSPGSVSAAQHARKNSLRSARDSARAKRFASFLFESASS